jgi:hypothetical protein
MLRSGIVATCRGRLLASFWLLSACILALACSSSDPGGLDGGPDTGVPVATGGSARGTGGALAGTGGNLGVGGAKTGTGGALSGTGGKVTGAGGTQAGTGGKVTGVGGTVSGTGGKVTGTGGKASGTGGTSVSGTGGKAATGGTTGVGGATGGATGVGGTTSPTHCTADLPAGAQPAEVSKPASVIGSGTAADCTFEALNAAVKKGGVITFNCGAGPVTIPVTATMVLPVKTDTVIDGGNTITLDGQHGVQIFNFTEPDFMKNEARVTLQRLTVINGKTTPTEVIPEAPVPCSQGYNDGEGGALFMRNGNLTIIDCTFSGNQGAPRGPDTGGGAIYILGSKHGALIVNSVFTNNQASNAGAVGALFATLEIYNSVFRDNKATGDGANSDDASKCDAINNDQHEVGSGGNGGAIYQDGASATKVFLCGVDVENNAAGSGAFGGGVFMTSNDFSGTITVQDSIITGNSGGHWTQTNSGPDLGTAFGVNAKTSTIINSTLQGVK